MLSEGRLCRDTGRTAADLSTLPADTVRALIVANDTRREVQAAKQAAELERIRTNEEMRRATE